MGSNGTVTENAVHNINKKKFDENYERIWGKKDKKEVKHPFDIWLDEYAEGGIHLEGLTPKEYGQAIWAALKDPECGECGTTEFLCGCNKRD